MNDRLTFDSDALIDHLRGYEQAGAYFAGLSGPIIVSTITVAELYVGVRDGPEREALDAIIEDFEVIPVDTEIARIGGLFRRTYLKSHNLGLADALIAATAVREKARLVTLNRKHFPMLPDLIVPYQKP